MSKMPTNPGIVRKNLMVDRQKIKRLRQFLKVESESAAVRQAIDQVLDIHEALGAARRLRQLGTLGDAYEHLNRDIPLELPSS